MNRDRPHHLPNGFRNNYPSGWTQRSYWQWQVERWRKGLPKIPEEGWRFDALRPDVAWLKANRTLTTITWIGHATFLLQVGGLNILTDPHLTERASPLRFAGPKRWMPPALGFQDLPPIDCVVISHNHYDHLDAATVSKLHARSAGAVKFFVPLGLKAWFRARGIANALELDWWEVTEHAGLTLHFTPAQHWSARSTWDRNRTLWGGWRIDHPRFRFFFAGDTGYSQDFKDIRARLGPVDLAALPIGAYEPRWFMGVMHVNPEEAARIHQDLGARHSVAMHWGTFVLTDEPLDEPPERLRKALRAAGIAEERFWVIKHGETRRLDSG